MAPNPRVAKAFRAMKELGIPEAKTKPVLKQLLKVFDKSWEPIEEDGYRALIDAIFESDESEAAEQKKKLADAEAAEKKKVEQAEIMKAIEEETQIQEELEKPLKRQRLRHQDSQASPSCIDPNTSSSGELLKVPKLEVTEVPESQPELQLPAEIICNGPILRTDLQPVSPQKQDSHNREQADLPIVLIKPKDEPLTDGALRVEGPLALIVPESLTNGDTSTENNLVKEPDPTETMILSNCVQEMSNETNGSTTILDIASSSSGAIKISLFKADKGNPKFYFVNEDSLLKKAEDKCLKSYKFLDTNFSLKKLMKDMCDCLLDFGSESDHSGEPPINTFALPPTGSLQTVIDFEKETENGFEENKKVITDEIIDIAKGQEIDLGSDHSVEPPVNTYVLPPIDSLETVNDFEKETENGFEENNHVTTDEIIDIAKGQESVMISLVNEVNSECPPPFYYIPRNAVFQNAYVDFSLARITNENCCATCFGNCLTSSTPCPCALQIGGEFAYTNEGTLKEDILDDCIETNRDPQKCHLLYCKECPLEKAKNEGVLGTCKGHIDRSFIKECWLKCGCDKKCGNRIVQGGIRYKLQVFMTPDGKGWGLRALEDLAKGAFVCEFVGEVLTCKELYNRVSQSSQKDEYAYPVFLDAEWGEDSESKEDEALCLDGANYGNVARFINHRCFDANLVEIPVEVENPDRHYYHVAFFTSRKVKALEELTRDYGIDFDDDKDLIKAFECKCGSQFCRDIKSSSGSRKRKCAEN